MLTIRQYIAKQKGNNNLIINNIAKKQVIKHIKKLLIHHQLNDYLTIDDLALDIYIYISNI